MTDEIRALFGHNTNHALRLTTVTPRTLRVIRMGKRMAAHWSDTKNGPESDGDALALRPRCRKFLTLPFALQLDSHRPFRLAHLRGTWGSLLFASALFAPTAQASPPGQAERLAGAEAQGAATPGAAALHHNPAALTWSTGYAATLSLQSGIEDQRSSAPGRSGDSAIAPLYSGLLAATAVFDNVAIGLGAYGLGNRYRPHELADRSWQRAEDPDWGCRWAKDGKCPILRHGGEIVRHSDATLAIGYRPFERWALGISAHLPFLRRQGARNEVLPADRRPSACADPIQARSLASCNERLSYDVRSRYRLFGLNPSGISRLDFALTLGMAFEFAPGYRLGLRYRTRPLLEQGRYNLSGQALHCPAQQADGLCSQATSFDAELSLAATREAAIGWSMPLNRQRTWTLDTQVVWRDECPGLKPCTRRATERLLLTGVDDSGAWISDLPIYHGQRDSLQVEAWSTFDKRTVQALRGPLRRLSSWSWISGLAAQSPTVDRRALTAADDGNWTVKATLGARFDWQGRATRLAFVPGYGVDWVLPARVGSNSLFDPAAADQFIGSGGDIYHPSANAVLSGRARPSNEGRYQTWRHVFLLSLRLSARSN